MHAIAYLDGSFCLAEYKVANWQCHGCYFRRVKQGRVDCDGHDTDLVLFHACKIGLTWAQEFVEGTYEMHGI